MRRPARPGRIREKLAALLTEATGRPFYARNIWGAEGYWRRASIDCYRWSAAADDRGPILDSYDTMTECARCGIEFSDTEVYAKGRE
jgi:hypothetical protein